MGQQLLPLAPLSTAWPARMGKTWTVTNESPATVPSTLNGTPYATLSSLPELPGYILVRNSSYDDGSPEYQLLRSEEHTSELQSLMRISYAVFCLKKKQQ